jgi:hypothetical protein
MWSRFDFLVLINFCYFKSKNRFTDVSHMKNLLKMSFIVKKKKEARFYTQILTILVAKKRASILLICLPPFFSKKNKNKNKKKPCTWASPSGMRMHDLLQR